jgi:anthraniloyl-CoA monooxygenase
MPRQGETLLPDRPRGPQGLDQVPWEEDDAPLDQRQLETLAPSPCPGRPNHPAPRDMDRADMDAVRDQFVAATRKWPTARL